jgi:hypothetical protein
VIENTESVENAYNDEDTENIVDDAKDNESMGQDDNPHATVNSS